MSTRDQLYRHFGPRLVEAIVRKLFDEINVLRANAGLPERTVQQAIDAVKGELDNIPAYDWEE
jgi:hypothetical protein